MFSSPVLRALGRLIPALLGCTLVLAATVTTEAQVLYSFESGVDGFIVEPGTTTPFMQSATGATDGAFALEVETGSAFGFDVRRDEVAGSPGYDLWNLVSANPDDYTLDVDFTIPVASWLAVQDVGTYFSFGIRTNSDGGFDQKLEVIAAAPGSAFSGTASLPVASISSAVDSSFYQLVIGTDSDFTAGLGGEGIKYYVDNIRFSPISEFIETKLFSWETPDDPGTPDVNEQFEGWVDGFADQPFPHGRSITSLGATDGASALQVDTPGSGFTWGSQFVLDSGEGGDPATQAMIDQYIADFNTADKIAVDVTFPDDQFPNFPTYETLFLNLSDSSGNFYQAQQQAGNPGSLAGDTVTVEFPIDTFSAGGANLGDVGLQEGSTFFRIALATNSNSANTIYIDNLRLIAEASGVDGDYNNDGVVDAADYTVWRDNEGAAEGTLPNDADGGVIGAAQYNTWAANYGASTASSATAVPEPGSLVLLVGAVTLAVGRRRA